MPRRSTLALGKEELEVANNSHPLRLLWPEIDDAQSAKQASRLGVFASVLFGLLTSAPAIYRIIRNMPEAHDDLVANSIVTGLFILLAVGIWLMWRVPAIVALSLYLLAWAAIVLKEGILSGYILMGAMASFFISGVRGTVAYRRLSGLPAPVDLRDA